MLAADTGPYVCDYVFMVKLATNGQLYTHRYRCPANRHGVLFPGHPRWLDDRHLVDLVTDGPELR